MAKLKFSGKVIKKELKKFDKFQKLELVVENEDMIYSKPKVFPIKVSLSGKKVAFADERVEIGDRVNLDCHVEGREWEGKYYINLIVDYIDYAQREENSHKPEKQGNPPKPNDDLPF